MYIFFLEIVVEILFISRKNEKLFNSHCELVRHFGKGVAERIEQRLTEMSVAETLQTLSHLPPPRCHELRNVKPPTFSVDVSGNLRLLFTPRPPIPKTSDNQIDRTNVRAIIVLEVRDTHEGKVRR